MKPQTLLVSTLFMVAGALAAPVASATCDISETKCAVNGGKCNIKFKNRTGDTGGSDGNSNVDQTSSAQTIVVKARKDNGKKAGNKLSILAGASGTMNFDKKAKKNFDNVQVLSEANSGVVSAVKISCRDIKTVLDGNGTCKIFHGKKGTITGARFYLGYQCDGGNVGGPMVVTQ